MRKSALALLAGGCAVLAGCTETGGAGGPSDLATRLGGVTAENVGDGAVVTFGRDGSLSGTGPSGEPLEGTYRIENGLYCSIITEPALGDRGCSEVTFGDGRITFRRVGSDTPSVWEIRS